MNNTLNHSWAYRWSFYLFIVFLIFSGISISVSQASLALSLIIWLFGFFKKYDDIRYYRSGLERYVLIFVIVSFLLAFTSPNIIENLIYIKDFWLIAILVLTSSLIDSRGDISKILKIIMFIAIINSLVAIGQYITDINLISSIKFELAHKKFKINYDNGDVAGFLGNHLTYSGYMMVILIPLIYLSFLKLHQKRALSMIFIRVSAFLAFLAVILSWARSIIITLPFGVIPLGFKRIKLFVGLFLSVIILVLLIFSNFGPWKNIKRNIYDESSQMRIVIWRTAFNVWLSHPLVGTGGGNYLKEFNKEIKKISTKPLPKFMKDKLDRYNYYIRFLFKNSTHPHNDYLNQLVRKGIIGFIAFFYMLYGIFKYMATNIKYIEDRFARYLYMGLFGAFCCFLAASMFQCYYTDEENLAMFWFVIGLMVAIVKVEKRDL